MSDAVLMKKDKGLITCPYCQKIVKYHTEWLGFTELDDEGEFDTSIRVNVILADHCCCEEERDGLAD